MDRKELLKRKTSYRVMKKSADIMDRYYLDGIIGLLQQGVGDFLSTALALPFIYFSAFHVRSFPLTLAVIYNILVDIMFGLFPFFIGDVIDFFNKSYVQNMRMITGYVEDDKKTVSEVNGKAVKTGVMIVVLCAVIYLLVRLLIWIAGRVGDLFSYFGNLL